MEKKIDETMNTNPTKAEMTQEQTIKHLKSDLRELRANCIEQNEELHRKIVQVQSLTDVLCDLRKYAKDLESTNRWDQQRISDYRDTMFDISNECEKVVRDYQNSDPDTVRPSKAVYNFANKILDITKRF